MRSVTTTASITGIGEIGEGIEMIGVRDSPC